MLHNISAGRREMGNNLFLQDLRTRIPSESSRRAMSQSMILRITSNGSPAEHEALVSFGEKITPRSERVPNTNIIKCAPPI